ncbi:MAG: tail fiber domain-containing protein, partial [Porticoccaceae bacterium]
MGSASNGFQTFAAAGVLNGDVVQYVIEEGANFEIGTGTYSSTGSSLTRSPTESSNSNNAITLAGQATVSITAVADDLNRLQHSGSDKVTVSSTGASVTGNLAVSGTVDGRDVASDGSKLDGIESGATGDQTASEIRALVESASDSNVFTDADHSKLNGIEAGATGDQTNAEIRAAVEAATDSNVFTDADHTKLNGIEANAKNDQTITAGGGLTGGGTGDVTISHSDTSSQASVNGSGRTYIQDITLDTYGHVTGLATATETVVNTDTNTIPNNATITLSAGNALTGGGNFTTDQSSNETITFNHSDTSSQGSVNNSGRTYIQDITLDGYGHVTGINSATETVTNTNTNQLTTFQVEDGDGTEVTISHGKEWKFVEAGGININWTDTSTGSDGDPFDLSFNVSTSITAGGGLTGGGALSSNRTISHADTSSQGSVNNSGRTYIQDITLDTYGHITGITSATETVVNTDTNTTYSAGAGLDLSGTTFSIESDVREHANMTIGNNSGEYIYFNNNLVRFYAGSNEEMRLESDGDLHVDGNVTAYSTTVSDERLKTDIKRIEGALDKVCALSGYTFTYKHD